MAAPPGSRRLATQMLPGSDIQALAFSSAQRRSVVMTNLTGSASRLRAIIGSRGGRLQGWRTSATESFRTVRRRNAARGRVDIVLPP